MRNERSTNIPKKGSTQTAYDLAAAAHAPDSTDSDGDEDKLDLEETVLHEEDDDVVNSRRRQASMEEKRLKKEKADEQRKHKILSISKSIDADDDHATLDFSSDEETSPIISERKSFQARSPVKKPKPMFSSRRERPRPEARVNSDGDSSADDAPISRGSRHRSRRDARKAKRAGKSGLDARVAKAKVTYGNGITADDNFSDDWDD